jgi:hypothetical protein
VGDDGVAIPLCPLADAMPSFFLGETLKSVQSLGAPRAARCIKAGIGGEGAGAGAIHRARARPPFRAAARGLARGAPSTEQESGPDTVRPPAGTCC